MESRVYRTIFGAVLVAMVCSIFSGLSVSGEEETVDAEETIIDIENMALDTEEALDAEETLDAEEAAIDTEEMALDAKEMAIDAKGVALDAEEAESINVKLAFDRFPDSFTCEGDDTSPEIQIGGINATSMAMIVDDPDAPVGTYTHWVIWNIPPVDVIPANVPKNATVTEPIQAVQGNNSAGEIGYLGPCPPPGNPHRYFFRVYGLDTMLDIQPGASRQDLEKAMQGHVLQRGEAMATYGR